MYNSHRLTNNLYTYCILQMHTAIVLPYVSPSGPGGGNTNAPKPAPMPGKECVEVVSPDGMRRTAKQRDVAREERGSSKEALSAHYQLYTANCIYLVTRQCNARSCADEDSSPPRPRLSLYS